MVPVVVPKPPGFGTAPGRPRVQCGTLIFNMARYSSPPSVGDSRPRLPDRLSGPARVADRRRRLGRRLRHRRVLLPARPAIDRDPDVAVEGDDNAVSRRELLTEVLPRGMTELVSG